MARRRECDTFRKSGLDSGSLLPPLAGLKTIGEGPLSQGGAALALGFFLAAPAALKNWQTLFTTP